MPQFLLKALPSTSLPRAFGSAGVGFQFASSIRLVLCVSKSIVLGAQCQRLLLVETQWWWTMPPQFPRNRIRALSNELEQLAHDLSGKDNQCLIALLCTKGEFMPGVVAQLVSWQKCGICLNRA